MDYNSYLRPSMLLIGKFAPDAKTFQVDQRKRRLSYICAIVSFICSFKTLCISLSSNPHTILYLVELYIVEGYVQRFFLLGITLLHAAAGFSYLYWIFLVGDVLRFECLDFLFIQNLDELCQRYGLKKKATRKFIQTADRIGFLMNLFMISFEGVFVLFLTRCLVVAYLKINFFHFLLISLPIGIVTLFSFHCLTFGVLSMYSAQFTTQQFLALRTELVSKKMRKFTEQQARYAPSFGRTKFWKATGGNALKIMTTINCIVIQFSKTNRIFEKLLR